MITSQNRINCIFNEFTPRLDTITSIKFKDFSTSSSVGGGELEQPLESCWRLGFCNIDEYGSKPRLHWFGGQVCDGGLHGDYGEDCCCSCWFCSCLLLRHLSTVLRCCLRSCALSCRWPFPFPSPDHRTVLRFRSVDHGIADCRTHDSLLY